MRLGRALCCRQPTVMISMTPPFISTYFHFCPLSIVKSKLTFGAAIGGLPSIGLPPLGLIVGIVALTFIAALAGEE